MRRFSGSSGATFRGVVIQPAAVRSAFGETRVTRWWWAAILRLHGKPAGPPGAPPEATKGRVAAGFRFYAALYGLLGAATAGVALSAVVALGAVAAYWGLLGGAAGAFLLAAARVAWVGARAYERRPAGGVPTLMLFLAMVAVYLTFAMAVASVAVEAMGLASPYVNVGVLAGVVVFGLGSYAVEMAYLLHVAAADGPNG